MRFDVPRHETSSAAFGCQAGEDSLTQTFVCAELVGGSRLVAGSSLVGGSRSGRVAEPGFERRIEKCIREQVERIGGCELELDHRFLLVFPSATAGLRCAIAIQRALEAGLEAHARERAEIRIAIHTGEVKRDGDHVFGRNSLQATENLIVLFRLLELASGGEILLSEATQRRVTDRLRFATRRPRVFLPRGLRRRVHFAALPWCREPRSENEFAGGPALTESSGLVAS